MTESQPDRRSSDKKGFFYSSFGTRENDIFVAPDRSSADEVHSQRAADLERMEFVREKLSSPRWELTAEEQEEWRQLEAKYG